MNVLQVVFIIVVIIFVFISVGLTVYFFTNLYLKRKATSEIKKERIPPQNYAEKVGLQCPDGYILTNSDPTKKTHLCKNVFQVPVKNETKCYTGNISDKTIQFNDLDWSKLDSKTFILPDDTPGRDTICKFKKDCGSEWTGVNTMNGWVQCT